MSIREQHWIYGKIGSTKSPHKRMSDLEVLPAGSKVKVVMYSRFGDVGITTDLTKEFGYSHRINPANIMFDDITEAQRLELINMGLQYEKQLEHWAKK